MWPFDLFFKKDPPKYKEGQKGIDIKGRPIVYKNGKWYIDNQRKRNNTSPTAEKSQQLENYMHALIIKGQRKRSEHGAKQSWEYAIPYIQSKEIKLSGTQSHNGFRVPTNALDSIAKYAGMEQVPIQTALGLPFQETSKGERPYFNYDNKGKVKGMKGFTKRDLGNTNYFKNFGIIPAENFVRDFEYTTGGYNNGKPITNIPPLQHAFQHFKKGRYNPGDSSHTQDVTNVGEDIWKSPEIQKWWKESGETFYNTNK